MPHYYGETERASQNIHLHKTQKIMNVHEKTIKSAVEQVLDMLHIGIKFSISYYTTNILSLETDRVLVYAHMHRHKILVVLRVSVYLG